VTGDSSGARTFCSAHWTVNLKQITIKIQIRITNSVYGRMGFRETGWIGGRGGEGGWIRLDSP